ncbi:hypothetical protein ElyMa_003979800 [Elysia marginata]|uniref:Ricin B lectin domain-containing protein n=1 Tax=Elysia marginata TaxID=1093978 RepID=A0AAV4FX10_9GAST|nr:hypothetical protein ElyMa_003979800 [Elysia marginata]
MHNDELSTAWFISSVRVPKELREGYGICRDGTNIQQEQLGGSITVQHCGRGPDLKSYIGLREGYGICRDGTNVQQEQLGGSITVQHCGRGPGLKSYTSRIFSSFLPHKTPDMQVKPESLNSQLCKC